MSVMNLQYVPFADASRESWEAWISAIPESTYLHSYDFLAYLHAFLPDESVLTFACLNDAGDPVAICPLGISDVMELGIGLREASFNGAGIAVPALREMRPSLRRRVMSTLLERIEGLAADAGASRILMQRHPVSLGALAGRDTGVNQLEPMQYGYMCHARSTMLVDLGLSNEELRLNLSKHLRKRLNRSEREGLTVVQHTGDSDITRAAFEIYREAHRVSAGRVTRPIETFEWMAHLLESSHASLFVTYVEGVPASHLYCGQFDRFAFGWSQANVEEFEQRFSPRHIVEWTAMTTYKSQGFKCYEIGVIWPGPQPQFVPSAKQESIAEYKRRFGGYFVPRPILERVLDRGVWVRLQEERARAFADSTYFASLAVSVDEGKPHD